MNKHYLMLAEILLVTGLIISGLPLVTGVQLETGLFQFLERASSSDPHQLAVEHYYTASSLTADNRIAFPSNGTVINYSPVPIIINASSYASLVELRVNQSEWIPLTRNDDVFLWLDETSSDFWYAWLPLDDINGLYTIQFRENGSINWNEELHISVDFSSIPQLSLDTVQLRYEYRLSSMTGSVNNNYTFDGASRAFQVNRYSNLLFGNETAFTGQAILNASEASGLLEKLTVLSRFIPNIIGTGLSEACCDEYYPTWTINITSGDFKRVLVYNERFNPPGFDDFTQYIELLIAGNFPVNKSAVSWDLGIGLLAVTALAVPVLKRKKR
ncbi:MAG: hypothetical protein ACFFD4_18440 [Candidatus Odinarchaeota archaeon]